MKVRLNATAEGRVTGGAKDRCGDIIFRREGALKIGISDIDLTVQFESHLTDYGANPNRSDPLGDTKIELQGKSRIGRINVSVSDIFAADMATYISGKILTKLAGSRLEKLIDGRVSRNLWVQDIYKNGTYFSLIDIVGYPSSLTFIGFANITLPRG